MYQETKYFETDGTPFLHQLWSQVLVLDFINHFDLINETSDLT